MFLSRPFSAVCFLAYAPLSLCAHVYFEVNLTWEIQAPDGQNRYVILSNGQFPGPQLNMNYGDDVEVIHSIQVYPYRADSSQFVVHNNLPFDSTVHFHGIEYVTKVIRDKILGQPRWQETRQTDTPWSDGTPGVAQQPIPSGGSFTYKWTATQYGAYWYDESLIFNADHWLTWPQVPRSRTRRDPRWSLWANIHYVRRQHKLHDL